MRDYSSRSNPTIAQQAEQQRARLDRLHMPAMPPLWLFARLGRAVQAWRKRRAVKALLKRDDHSLCDLGHSRAQLRQRLNDGERQRRKTTGATR
ncbi:hypothetical protein [Salinisphaera orenii]|uniref:hypothetical protein n=1 Tax=Salinisphaera orenii TaxID=856731 RepID=UPI0011CD8D19|nr:hypothetical protein [Salinisphaera halophila]